MLVILVVVLVLGMSHAQKIEDGLCPDVVTMKDFDIKQYAGRWYAQSWYPNLLEYNYSCMVEEYQPKLADKVDVKFLHVMDNNIYERAYSGHVVSPGRLCLEYNRTDTNSGSIDRWILHTDYKTYSVYYSCHQLPKFYIKFVGIYTRHRMVSEEKLKPAYDVLRKYGLKVKSLGRRDQYNCVN